jgi:hypothetical protein
VDENRLKKVVQSALDISYDKSLLISEFRALQTHMYDNNKCDWVPNSYSLFLSLKRIKDCDDNRNVSSFIESVIGFECVVDFV